MTQEKWDTVTEFTRILENGLRDLALGVTERLDSLEKKLTSGREEECLIEDMRNLKSFTEDLIKVACLRHSGELAGIPFLCYGGTAGPAASLINAVESALKPPKQGVVLLIGPEEHWRNSAQSLLPDDQNNLKKIHLNSMAAFNETVSKITPLLIVFNTLDAEAAAAVRRHPLTVTVPILMIGERIQNSEDVTAVSQYSRLMICHHAIVGSAEFQARVRSLIEGDDILSPHTGALVKKAILYFDRHAKSHISRWKLANTVNASEDYLTRIFHKEMGLSLWEYLNRYRIFLAVELLRQTDDTIQNIAFKTGFQDQAYFCRVFKKIYGLPPGQLRKQ
jgi:AraC-like DNA-binding protein